MYAIKLLISKIRGEQKADQEAIEQLYDRLKALEGYLGITYLHTGKRYIKG
jgi:hypothetical protein